MCVCTCLIFCKIWWMSFSVRTFEGAFCILSTFLHHKAKVSAQKQRQRAGWKTREAKKMVGGTFYLCRWRSSLNLRSLWCLHAVHIIMNTRDKSAREREQVGGDRRKLELTEVRDSSANTSDWRSDTAGSSKVHIKLFGLSFFHCYYCRTKWNSLNNNIH